MPWYHCPDNWSADIPIYRIAEGTNLQQLVASMVAGIYALTKPKNISILLLR